MQVTLNHHISIHLSKKTTPARKPLNSWNDEEEVSGSRTTTALLKELS
jgi:hypothetical protein